MQVRTKKMIITGAVALGGVGALGFAGIASAASATPSGRQSLAAAIASHFGVKQSDVQGVIDQQHANRMADRAAAIKTKLDAAVKAGTITSAQETLIEQKIMSLEAQLKADKTSFKTETPAQRKATRQAERASITRWMTANNIPTSLLKDLRVGYFGRGGHNRMTTPTASPAS